MKKTKKNHLKKTMQGNTIVIHNSFFKKLRS